VRTNTLAIILALAVSTPAVAFAQATPKTPTDVTAKPAAKPKPGDKAQKPAAPAPADVAATPPPPAPAPPPLSDTLTGEAKADYESGKVLFGDGDNANALVKFKSAYDKSKDPRLLWNMAACEKNLRHYSKTLTLVRQYLSEGGDKLSPDDRHEGEELIKVIEPLTAKLRLNVNEPGAEISIDDEVVGSSPLEPTVVDIGTRRVRVHKPEFEDYSREIAVGGAAEMAVDVALVKIVHEGRITVRSLDRSTIAVDGKVVGSGTWTGTLPSGGHALRVTAEGMRPFQSEVYLQDKEARNVDVTLEREPSKGLPSWAWIAGGVVVAGGLGVAGYFILKPEDKYEGPPGSLQPGIVQANHPLRF
jgi:hypothetical protein